MQFHQTLLIVLLIIIAHVDAFVPLTYTRQQSWMGVVRFSALIDELEEIWSRAARSGGDAVVTTVDVIKDRAFEYKERALGRIHGIPPSTVTVTATKPDGLVDVPHDDHDDDDSKKYNTDYRNAIALSEERFLKAIDKAEEQLARSIHRSEEAYDKHLKRQKHWTSDVVLRAKNNFIHSTAAAEELFQIAVEKAELSFEEAKIKADYLRDRQIEYFGDNGEYMHDEMTYLSLDFSNLIAF